MSPFFWGLLIGVLGATVAIVIAEIKKQYSIGDWVKDHILVPLRLAKKDA